MMKTIDLLNNVVDLGFDRESALEAIDVSLNRFFSDKLLELFPHLGEGNERFFNTYNDVIHFVSENRSPLSEEEIPDELYENILDGFKEELDA